MTLPNPTHSFTIPSVHDRTLLECRVYHPRRRNSGVGTAAAQKKAAIIAHPYAPLGGCFDDPIVNAVGKEILEEGWIVGLFNFRGAGDSAGRTSWTARAELADYISFYGFVLCYLSGLDSRPGKDASIDSASTKGDGRVEGLDDLSIILAGYSYGSMIASHLPPVNVVLDLFTGVTAGTSSSAIVRIAMELSGVRNMQMQSQMRSEASTFRESGSSLYELSYLRSTSAESKSSQDSGQRGTLESYEKELIRSRRRICARFGEDRKSQEGPEAQEIPRRNILLPTVSYLLICPILPPISSFATMSFLSSHPNLDTTADGQKVIAGKPEEQLTSHDTMAVYGSNDIFTSVKKLRRWSAGLSGRSGSRFAGREVAGAGHFWHEDGTEERMRQIVRDWMASSSHCV